MWFFMKLSSKSVLVTGAGGFIGSHLTEYLVKSGAIVKAFVRYNSRTDWGMLELIDQECLDSIEIFPGDLRDPDAVRHSAKDVDIIFHLGSLIAIPYSYTNPRETIETNIMGALNVLNASKENEVEKIVHTSTSEVYGTAKYVPIDENHPLQGQSPYSASKIGADKIAESFFLSYELPVSIIRPFNTYGPRQSARAIIPTIITQALKNEEIYLGSLNPTRDYTYVQDTVEAYLKIATTSKSIGNIINVGSNFEISIGDLAKIIINLIGKEVIIKTDKSRIRPKQSEVERLYCDNSKAKKYLGWKPKISLENGLENTIDWINEHIEQYKSEIYNR